MDERWRPIAGYEGLYEVSDQGRVRSMARTITINGDGAGTRYGATRTYRARILKPSRARPGRYLSVTLARDNTKRTFLVHLLVIQAFVGPAPGGLECRHLNGDSGDAALTNLCYGTRAENAADAMAHGTFAHGSRNGNAVLTESQADAIYHASGTETAIGRRFGVSRRTVHLIKTGATWRRVTQAAARGRKSLEEPSDA